MTMRNHQHCHYTYHERILVAQRLVVVVFIAISAVVVQSFQIVGISAPRYGHAIIKADTKADDHSPKGAWSSSTSSTCLSYSSRTCPPPPQGLEKAVISKLVADTVEQRKELERSISSLIQEVTTAQEFDDVILNNARQKDVLTVVRFHAPFCPACKAGEPSFHRMIYNQQKQLCEHLQQRQQGLFRKNAVGLMNVHWVSVALTRENDDLRERLGLEVIPFGQIYHPSAGLVEGLNLGRKFITDFDETLQTYISQKCPIPEEAEPELELDDPSVAFLNGDF